ncbi:MAG: SCP2 sterol-binding domain-containing protein [Actinomycetia bacterium]|nr:SCP2 sterol-binding domain-containing protein [Actinomycetes bacterium]
MQYLDDEWMVAADKALADGWASVDEQGDSETTIGYTVKGAPSGKVTYTVRFGPDGAGVSAGKPEGDPSATMELDYDTAAEIAQGESSAQVAFMQGRLKLGGDVTLLIRGADQLAAAGDALGSLRDQTQF